MANQFESIISAKAVGTADVQAQAEAMRKLAESIEGLGQKATKINEHPGFSAFADKVKQGIENPLAAAGEGAKALLEKLGPAGTGIAAAATAIGAIAAVGFEAAKSLGEFGDRVGDTAIRMGLTTKEVGQFSFAMKFAGGEMSSLESIMRKLSAEVDSGGKNLKAIGVDYRELGTGKIRPTSQIVLELSERLKAMPEVYSRNAAAIKIMGRGALEVLPDLLGLSEGVKRAKEMGLGATDEDLKRWEQYHRSVAEAEALWESFARKVKEPIAAVVTVMFKGSDGHEYTVEELQKRGVNFGGFAPRSAESDRQAALAAGFGQQNLGFDRAIRQDRLLGFTGEIEERRRTDAAIARLFGQRTLDDQLKAAEKDLSELGVPAAGASSMADVNAYATARDKVRALKAQIEATKELEAAMKSLDAFEKQMSERGLDPIGKIFAQRDELAKSTGQYGRATDAALRGALPELAKGWADTDKQTLSVFQRAGEANGKPYLEWAKEQIEGLERGSGAVVKNFTEWVNKSKDVADAINDIEVNSNRSEIMARSGKQLGLANSRFGPGQEGQAIAFAYQERTRLARELYDFEWSHAKTLIDQEKAFADWKRASQDAEIEHEVRLAELQRRRIEEFRGEMGGLFDALMGGKDGLQQFAMGQARNVGRAVFSNTMTSLATGSGITRQSTFAGAGLLGDMLGGQSNPLKAATDTNTVATMENTRAMMAFSARMATSASGGGGGFAGAARSLGGGFSSGGWSTSGTAGDTGYTTDGVPRYSSENYDDYGVFLGAGGAGGHDPSAVGASARGGGGFNASKAAGYGASAAGVGFGIYGIAKSPSTKGKLASGGAALMSVAPLTGPAAPFVAAAGMALEVFSAVMKDPKQVRAEELDRERKSRAFNMPTGYEYEVDTSGRSYDHDYTGRLRPIINITNNVQTFDPQNFQDYLVQNPDAVSKGVSNAIYNDGGQITASMSQVLA